MLLFLLQVLRPFCKVPNLKVWKYYTTENLSTGPTYDLELINNVTTTTENEQQSGDGRQVLFLQEPVSIYSSFFCKTIRKGNIARFTTHVETRIAVNRVVACRFREYWLWLDKIARESLCYVTCCRTSLPWAGKTYNLCKFCCKKVEILSTLCNNVLQPVGGWVVERQVWTWVVKRTFFLYIFVARFTDA